MKLIFGGAYQGKLDYALSLIDRKAADETVYTCPSIFDCTTPEECMEAIDIKRGIARTIKDEGFEVQIINHLEHFTYACADAGRDATAYMKEHPEIWKDKIIIVDDISQGVVPTDVTERAWREMNGRLMAYLSGEAETVVRMFCGIPQIITRTEGPLSL